MKVFIFRCPVCGVEYEGYVESAKCPEHGVEMSRIGEYEE